jgi:hypothetical protein
LQDVTIALREVRGICRVASRQQQPPRHVACCLRFFKAGAFLIDEFIDVGHQAAQFS